MPLHPAYLTSALELPGCRIAFRYDVNEVMQAVTEVLAYGTAVIVEALVQEVR